MKETLPMRTLVFALVIVCAGCGLVKDAVKDQAAKTSTAATEATIDRIIDSKVDQALERRVGGAVSEGISKLMKDVAPIALSILVTLIAGKLGIDLKKSHDHVKRLKENGKS
jgi:hypothetical protein